jgi:hypothetical protein
MGSNDRKFELKHRKGVACGKFRRRVRNKCCCSKCVEEKDGKTHELVGENTHTEL